MGQFVLFIATQAKNLDVAEILYLVDLTILQLYCAHPGCRNPTIHIPGGVTDCAGQLLPSDHDSSGWTNKTLLETFDHIDADHFGNNSYKCYLCAVVPMVYVGRSFPTREAYRVHLTDVHPQQPPTPLHEVRPTRNVDQSNDILRFLRQFIKGCPPPSQARRYGVEPGDRPSEPIILRRPSDRELQEISADFQQAYGVVRGQQVFDEMLARLPR